LTEIVPELPWYVDVGPVRRWLMDMKKKGNLSEARSRIGDWKRMVEEHQVVRTRTQGKVGIIELCYAPKANALVPPMYRMFTEALRSFAENEDVWTIVVTGAGKSFSSGGYVGRDAFYAGLDAGGHASTAEPMRRTFTEMFQTMQRDLYECEKPTIAMLNGPAIGESVDLALAADIRTGHAGSDLWFSYGYTGNTAYCGGAWLLPRMVGVSIASKLILTAARISGTRAEELGIITQLSDAGSLVADTMGLAERIVSLPPITLRLLKKEIHRGLEIGSFTSNLDVTSMIEPIVQFTSDHMDAEESIIEKRKPVVRGA